METQSWKHHHGVNFFPTGQYKMLKRKMKNDMSLFETDRVEVLNGLLRFK